MLLYEEKVRTILTIALSIFSVQACFAQAEADRKIIFTGQGDPDRQIRNMAHPQDSVSAVAAGKIHSNALIFTNATGTDSLTFPVSPAPPAYAPGQMVLFRVAASNTGPVVARINSLPYKPLTDNSGRALYGSALISGQIVTALYNGSEFRITDSKKKNCPTGFVAVDHDYCIEVDERPWEISTKAVDSCYSNNARLCSVMEWYNACRQSGTLGLQNMTNNFEWIDDSANHAHTMSQMGNGSCTFLNSVTIPTPNKAYFRCCFSR